MSESTKKNAFEAVPPQFNFAQAERELIQWWKSERIYERSLEQRKAGEPFVFFEGPPTANGLPHPGHALTRTIKDIFPRYKTMAGYYCERKAGWDTHGLPVEVEVCKQLGIIDGGKQAIEEYGIEAFNRACIESVFRYQREWEELTDRIGFWVNLKDAYVTFHQSYVGSVWWALKTLFERGLLYQGHKVVWWWAQGGTALSAGEVGEGYRDTDDPAITVSFQLTEESAKHLGISHAPLRLLVWTTTPWTLLSNCAACVGADIDYAIAKVYHEDDRHEFVILAEALVEGYFGDKAEVLRTLKGEALLGLHYTPIFHYDTPKQLEADAPSTKHWTVIAGDFVDISTGTGIVHIAPAFGEDDYRVCKENGIGFLCFVKPDGTFDARVTDIDPFEKAPLAGQFCKAADKAIIRILKERGVLLKQEQYRHPYPFCPRADKDPLIQYARKSWFIRTSQFKGDFLANNAEISWQPEHIRDGRFGNFLENNVDWALSRERFWGTPLPIWICEQTGHMECIASYDELLAKPGVQGTEVWAAAKAATPELSEHLKVHKPYIDAITYDSPKAPGARMKRVTEVIDVWFDAGSMPFAQWGYPHAEGSAERFDQNFPADFISEAIDQTRGWFYALLAISTVVHGKTAHGWPHPFKNCICLGHILAEDGLKLSKRLKNYSEPKILMDKFSADAMRWSFISKNPPTSSIRFSDRAVEEAQREFLIRWHNVYSFFVIYANLDGFAPTAFPGRGACSEVATRAELDRWVLNELARTVIEVRRALDAYDPYPAARALLEFVDGLSNWYVRRSRPRFWGSEWTQDKKDAYWTLYECLLTLAKLAAPFTPFYAETTWQNLTRPVSDAPASVHLSDYPSADAGALDHALLEQMAVTREAVNLGLSARKAANIKVRQPLGQCQLILANPALREGLERHFDLIREELNIKEMAFAEDPEQYVAYEIRPNFKVLGPKVGKKVQDVRLALAEANGAALYTEIQQAGHITLALGNGDTLQLDGADIEVRLTPKPGFAAAQGRHLVAIITTEITEALRHEGYAREFIRAVQDLRKELNLPYDARIRVNFGTEDSELASVVAAFADAIKGETLALEIVQGDAGPLTLEIDGKPLSVSIRQ